MGAIKIYNSRNFADSKRDDIPCVVIPWLYFVIFHDFFCFFILVVFFLLFLFLFFSIFIFSFALVCFYLTWSWNQFFLFQYYEFFFNQKMPKSMCKICKADIQVEQEKYRQNNFWWKLKQSSRALKSSYSEKIWRIPKNKLVRDF